MNISVVVADIYAKSLMTTDAIFAPGPLAHSLIEGLISKGHKVSVYGPEGSEFWKDAVGESQPLLEEELRRTGLTWREYSKRLPFRFAKIAHEVAEQVAFRAFLDVEKNKTDIIHFFLSSVSTPWHATALSDTPVVFTLHDNLPQRSTADIYSPSRYAMYPRHNYVSISNSQRKGLATLNFVDTVYNGVDADQFGFSDQGEDAFVWLGRATPEKGAHIAVKAAVNTNQKLLLASSPPPAKHKKYWEEQVEALYAPGRVLHIGMLDRKQVVKFLQNAKAVLFPIEWEEPFGMVMIEAMACGTPVIAFDRGSVREVIKDGVTGFIVQNEADMEEAMCRVETLDREACRKHVEEKFSTTVMVDGYENVYNGLIQNKK